MLVRTLSGAAVSALIAMAQPVAAQSPVPPPVEAYGNLPALDHVVLSDDGARIAFVAQVGDKRVLSVRPFDGQKLGDNIGKPTDLGAAKIRSVSWFGNTHVLISRSVTTDKYSSFGQTEYPLTQIYNVETGKFVQLLGSARGVGGSGPTDEVPIVNAASGGFVCTIDGKQTLMASGTVLGNPILFRIDPDTGVGRPFLRDKTGVLDPSCNAVADQENFWKEGRWRLVAREGASLREIMVSEGHEVDWPRLVGLGRTPGTVIVQMPERQGVDYLIEVNLEDGSQRKLSIAGGKVTPSPIYHPISRKLLGFAYVEENKIERVYLDETLARTWSAVELGFPEKHVSLLSATPDHTRFIVQTSGDDDSGTYWLVDRPTNKAMRMGAAYPGVPASAVNEVQWIRYRASDGLEIPAYLTLPRGRAPENLPLVVLPHGGPQARDMPGFDWWSQAIASRGYAVLQPQFRGSDGFGNEFVAAGYGEWGRKMQTDLSDGVRHLAAQGIVDPKRVCINGWSYGGYAAMAGPTLDPGVYRCSIAGAGVSDLRRMLFWANGESHSADTFAGRYWKQNMGADKIGDRDLDTRSPARNVGPMDAPMLILHGDDDTVVPIEQSEIMARALKTAGKPHEYVVLKDEDHWMSTAKGRLEVMRRTLDWLQKHNPAD
jgi:dienelactone hydrolase